MALTHITSLRNQMADLVVDALDAGAGAGVMLFRTSGNSEVATVTFSDPAFGAAASGIATANAITSDTNATGGIIANFQWRDSDANAVLDGTVTVSGGGGDITMSSTTIGAGDTVEVTSLTYTAAA